MSRIHGMPADGSPVRIDESKVSQFFEQRAARIPELGPTRAVIYQDHHPDLAERRDQHERSVLTPLLRLDGAQRLLDVGCGTGRWTATLGGLVSHYHGIDFAPGLVEHARREHGDPPRTIFSVADASDFNLSQLGETQAFDRALVSGVFIYLNDDALTSALGCLDRATTPDATILLREPIAQDQRLTLVDHHSVDLDAEYHAIYRTRAELLAAANDAFAGTGRVLADHGSVYDDPTLNNRSETRQEWFLYGPGQS
jgi:SAM-dependent methyltransferase